MAPTKTLRPLAHSNAKKEKDPKLEPIDDLITSAMTIPKTPMHQPQGQTLALVPSRPITHLPSPRSVPSNLSDERLRLLRRSLASKKPPNPSRALVLFNNTGGSGTLRPRPRPQPRSGDLRRVSAITSNEAFRIRAAVRRARILYESIRTRLLREEEATPVPWGRRSRADLNAATAMKDAGLWLNREHRTVGFIPGIYIGDVFIYRMELCVLGIHGQVQGGIDFVAPTQSESGEPIATSVIVSGGYEDDEDAGDVIVYTGQGGREGKNETRHSVDQKLVGGNLALERSCHYGIEIRVVRGLDCNESPTGRLYVYDGLFKVAQWWSEFGKSGFIVFKFRLERIEGQEEMGSSVIRQAESLKKELVVSAPVEEQGSNRGYLSRDITKGKETKPVAVYNDIDGNRDPLLYDYMVRPAFRSFVVKQIGGQGCSCDTGSCSDGCECLRRNGGEPPYDDDGRLLRGRPIVYECGRFCGCAETCTNRVSQKGPSHRLEVFRSAVTGWGVRSLDFIQAGEFVCEYGGVLLSEAETEAAAQNGAAGLVYPNSLPKRWQEWGDVSKVVSKGSKKLPATDHQSAAPLPDVRFSIDVSRVRNVACYLSHSCIPNVFAQYVLFNHYNVEYPRVMVFAMENIPPMRELSLDYGVGDMQG